MSFIFSPEGGGGALRRQSQRRSAQLRAVNGQDARAQRGQVTLGARRAGAMAAGVLDTAPGAHSLDCMVSQAPPAPRSPVDQAALAASLRAASARAGCCPAPPTWTRPCSPWEQRHFFGGGWMCVGRSDQIPGPGDQRAESVGQGSVLLVRGDDGVRARVREHVPPPGHELLPCGGATQQKVIICPYHSWTYTPGRGLRAAAGFKNQPGFAARRVGPGRSCRLPSGTAWSSWTAPAGAPPLADALGTLDEIGRALRAGAAGGGRAARLRDHRELEDSHRELPRVLPLPDRSTPNCAR